MNIVSRSQWLTVPWLGGSPAFEPNAVTHMTAHYAGGTIPVNNIPLLLNNMQNDYRVNRGYDLGYSYAIDPNGIVYEVRGIQVRAASDGAAETNRVTVSALFICPTVTSPLTGNQVTSAQNLMAYIRSFAPGALHWIGHRNVYATACPGDVIYRYVTSGILEPQHDLPLGVGMYYRHNSTGAVYVTDGATKRQLTGDAFYGVLGGVLAPNTPSVPGGPISYLADDAKLAAIPNG